MAILDICEPMNIFRWQEEYRETDKTGTVVIPPMKLCHIQDLKVWHLKESHPSKFKLSYQFVPDS